MSVVGIGLDVTLFSRIRAAYARHGPRLAAKMLHPSEAAELAALPGDSDRRARFLASTWAAKEAVYKAVGRRGLAFPHLRVRRPAGGGAPAAELATDEARRLAPHVHSLLLTLSHDGDYVAAMALALGPPQGFTA